MPAFEYEHAHQVWWWDSRTCVSCGARRNFDTNNWSMYGSHYFTNWPLGQIWTISLSMALC